MERDIVHKAIENPETLINSGSDTWQQLVARYPYFTAAQKLLLKSWQSEGDHRFTDQLYQAAVHSSDRQALYKFVRETDTGVETVREIIKEAETEFEPLAEKESTSITEAKTSTAISEPDKETVELVSRIFEEENPVRNVVITDNTESLQKDEKILITPEIPVEEVSIQEEEKEVVQASSLDPFERTLIVEAVRSSIEAEVSEKDTSEGVDTDSTISLTEDDNSYAAYILRRSRQLHFGEKSNEKPQDDETPAAAGDWLRSEIREEEEEDDENPVSTIHQTGVSHGSKKINIQDSRSHQKDLIDKFIRLEPHIARGKSTDYTPGNIAKESLEEDFSMVTETMAKLFASQGKIDKARKAYRKLMELYPEKSVYFAAQLKNLDRTKK